MSDTDTNNTTAAEVTLTGEEREAFGQRADSLLPNQIVYSLTSAEAIVRRRLAAERAAHEALREAIEALADEWESIADQPTFDYFDRIVNDTYVSRTGELRDVLAATAPTPPEDGTHRRGPDDGFHVGYHQFVTHDDYVAMTDAIGFGDDRTDPAATPAQLLPYLKAALDAQHEHIECERAAEESEPQDGTATEGGR